MTPVRLRSRLPQEAYTVFTDRQIARGLAAVVAWHDRCAICGRHDGLAHDGVPHVFDAVDVLTIFMRGCRREP